MCIRFKTVNVHCPRDKISVHPVQMRGVNDPGGGVLWGTSGCDMFTGELICQKCCADLVTFFNGNPEYPLPDPLYPNISQPPHKNGTE